MDTRSLLDQLLKSGKSLASQAGDSPVADKLKTPAGAAVAGGVLGLLLGNKKVRKMTGSAVTYGGVAALGALAWKAYENWQAQQDAPQQAQPQGQPARAALPAEPQTIEHLPAPQADQRCKAILKALICAARADGHIDEREQALLDEQFAALAGDDPAMRRWLHEQLNAPLDPAAVAAEATSMELACEIYLASVLMVDEQNFMEFSWLNELARQLKIDPALKAELEAQVRQQMAG